MREDTGRRVDDERGDGDLNEGRDRRNGKKGKREGEIRVNGRSSRQGVIIKRTNIEVNKK